VIMLPSVAGRLCRFFLRSRCRNRLLQRPRQSFIAKLSCQLYPCVPRQKRPQPQAWQCSFDAGQLFDVDESFAERVPERVHSGLSTRLPREPEAVCDRAGGGSDIGRHTVNLCRVDAKAPCCGAEAHDMQRDVRHSRLPRIARDREPHNRWRARSEPVHSQRRMKTQDAARAACARFRDEIVFPATLSDHAVQAAANMLNCAASDQRGQVSRSQSEVPYLLRSKVRGNAFNPEPVESATAQAMQSVEVELGEGIKCSTPQLMQNVHVLLGHVDILHHAAKG